MDSSGSSLSSLSGSKEATQILKDILNVGKTSSSSSPSSSHRNNADKEKIHFGTLSAQANMDGAKASTNGSLDMMSEFVLNMKESIPKQQIILEGDDVTSSFSVYGREVDVIASKTINAAGSNKVKINPVVNFDWDHKYYVGNLVAVHKNAVYVAYVLKGKSGGIVRVINRKTAERALVKGFVGRVTDIAFAHISVPVLAAVDEIGNLFVYEIMETDDKKIEPIMLLRIDRAQDNTKASDNHRVIWCPYIPEEDSSMSDNAIPEDVGKLLVLTHDEVAEMWNVDIVSREYGCGPMLASDVESGFITICNHQEAIVDASFSPDGTALATASQDGLIKFFQVYLHDKSVPRCLHQWKPHDGKPVSSLFFLDDHKHPNPEEQFWKFAITGADFNREIKVWSCESWTCLQTLTFSAPGPALTRTEPCIKATLDLSANYLVLSDIKRRVLYVLQLHQDSEAGRAHVSSVSEFLLTQPCLSLAILDASRRKFRKMPDPQLLADVTTGDIQTEEEEEVGHDEEGANVGVLVKMCSVHTKTLQELEIRFKPESSVPQLPAHSISSVSQDELGFRDGLSDMSIDTVTSEGEIMQPNKSHELLHQPLLLTPDAFKSHSPRKGDIPMLPDSVRSSGSSFSSFTHVTAMGEDVLPTPHSLLDHASLLDQAVPSPTSSITLTPTSSRDLSGSNHVPTPTSLPLPPVTPSEDDKVHTATPPLSRPSGFTSTSASHPATPVSRPHETSSRTQEVIISPTQDRPQDFTLEKSAIPLATSETLDEMFSATTASQNRSMGNTSGSASGEETYPTAQTVRRAKLQSTGSSSSTSLEISEILSHVRKSDTDHSLGENDESAEDSKIPPLPTQYAQTLEEIESATEEDNKKYTYSVWPKPPDVSDVNLEAQRLAAEAIQHSTLVDEGGVVVVGDEVDDEEDIRVEDDEEQEEKREEEAELDADNDVVVEDTNSVSVSVVDAPPTTPPSVTTQANQQPSDNATHIKQSGASGEPAPEVYLQRFTEIQKLQSTLDQMFSLMQVQQHKIEQLQKEVRDTKSTETTYKTLESRIDYLEGAVIASLTKTVTDFYQRESQNLHHTMLEREAAARERQEKYSTSLSQTLASNVTKTLDRTIKAEIKSNVLPVVSGLLEPIKEQLHTEIAQKLTATDSLMKDNINKLVRSRSTTEAIGQAAASAIQGPIQATYRDSFKETVIPAFDRSAQNMFTQINDTFQRGTQEYIMQLESHLDQVRQTQEDARDPLLIQLQTLVDSFQTTADALQSGIMSTVQAEIDTHLQTAVVGLQETVVSEVRQLVRDEINSAMKDHQENISSSVLNVIRSTAVTPVPSTPDPQVTKSYILSLLRQGQLNTAFQQALSASDLSLVMFVCETVDPSQVFEQSPCPLQQPVLLSLIQQLSADLIQNTNLKHKYLEEALMNLDPADPITREHMPTVLAALCQKIMTFVRSNPQDVMVRPMRMLHMASQSLLK